MTKVTQVHCDIRTISLMEVVLKVLHLDLFPLLGKCQSDCLSIIPKTGKHLPTMIQTLGKKSIQTFPDTSHSPFEQ